MGSLRGFSLLLRPLPLLVTSLVFSGVFCSSRGAPALCDVSCCSFQPTCDTAQNVTCNCPNMNDTMILQKGGIPETVKAINILNTRHVKIEKDAISGLHFLKSFILSGIKKLEIKQDGMASQKDSKLQSVTIQNVESLQVESMAISRVWSLEPNGHPASIFELYLHNITMDECFGGSFGGNISYTELINATIAEVKAKCFYGLNNFVDLKLKSLTIKKVNPEAFSGNMRALTIMDSEFEKIPEEGFHINVSRMEVKNTSISELRSNGLNVLAGESIRLDTVRVDHLRKDALVGLQIERNKQRSVQSIFIRKLEIIETENGCLTFSECTMVTLHELDIATPRSRICPTKNWTKTLSVGGVSGQLTPAQYELYKELQERHACPEDVYITSPHYVDSPECSLGIKGGVKSQNSSDATLDDGEDNTTAKSIHDYSNIAINADTKKDPKSEEPKRLNDIELMLRKLRDQHKSAGQYITRKTKVLVIELITLLVVLLLLALLVVLKWMKCRSKTSNNQQNANQTSTNSELIPLQLMERQTQTAAEVANTDREDEVDEVQQ